MPQRTPRFTIAHRHAGLAALAAMSLLAAACSGSDGAAPTTTVAVVETAAPTTTVALAPATFQVQPGSGQVAVLGAKTGDTLTLAGPDTDITGEVDEQGSLLFRDVTPGDGYTIRSETEASESFTVADPSDHPDAAFYAKEDLLPGGGFGYITTRDGTTLSANVMLPGPADQGPYPTVVEYSGYAPSNPDDTTFGSIFNALGFAYVGVNMRGTGCSGGSYRFFETAQSLDGYDTIEAVAAQPWVLDNEVGMVGISYPGISQLFVAATQPPSLEAISPLSVLDDSYRSTLYPGGILNTGFAVNWTKERMDSAKIYGQEWAKKRSDGGDTRCADNQLLRLQNPDLLAEIQANPFYSNPLGDSLAPATFVDRIEVPVFIAGAWQDEQTGGHFPAMLDRFTSSPAVYVTLTNGLHTESLSPTVFQRLAEFLQLYVAKQVPDMSGPNGVVPVLTNALYGSPGGPPFANRFEGQSYEQALAAFSSEPSVRVMVEQGAGDPANPGAALPNAVLEFPSWPIPTATATSWSLDGDGALVEGAGAKPGTDTYKADPTALPATFYTQGGSSNIWRADTTYDWRPLPDGTGLGYVTAPLASDTMVIGSGSVDLWLSSSTPDTDVEVTITEVRPDGQEIYVQSGWLRASQRALDEAASTELRPVHTHTEADSADLPAGEVTPVRVELFPFAHPFRAGSQIRLTIDAPGNNRPVWEFDTISAGEEVSIVHDADHPSRLVLPVVPNATIPTFVPPACGTLRGQPCRTWVAASNGG